MKGRVNDFENKVKEVEKYNENRFNKDDLNSYLNKISNALNVQKSDITTKCCTYILE